MICIIFERVIKEEHNFLILECFKRMKMKLLILSALSMISITSRAQILLYNDGATVKVQTGAVLYVEGGIQNTATGTIDNDGTIELKGDLLNLGTWESAMGDPNTLKFSGGTNSNVTTTNAQLYNVVVQKDATFNVNLSDNMTVTNNLDFNAPAAGTGNKISLGANNLMLGGSATVTGYDSDEFVMTGGAGSMKKSFTSLVSSVFPVGFNATTYNPATLNVTAGPNDTYSVRVLTSPTDGNGLTGAPITSDVVDAVWDIQETTAGGNTVDVTLGWAESDELTGFDDALNAVSKNDGVNGWDGLFADLGPEVGNTRTRTGVTSFSAFAVGDKTLANDLVINTKVFLHGPYSAGSMSDALRVAGYVPTTEPYTAAPFNYVHVGYGGGESVAGVGTFDQSGTNNDIVDWIILEIRDATTPATKLATRTALIQRDGDIVDLDALSALKVKGLADGTYHVGLKHRNHLPIRTQTALALSNTSTSLNFTTAGIAFDNGSTNNEPMIDLGSGVMGMWGGDVDNTNIVEYALGDRLAILQFVGTNTPSNLVPGYNREDVTMDGTVDYALIDRSFILTNVVGSSTPSKLINAHQ